VSIQVISSSISSTSTSSPRRLSCSTSISCTSLTYISATSPANPTISIGTDITPVVQTTNDLSGNNNGLCPVKITPSILLGGVDVSSSTNNVIFEFYESSPYKISLKSKATWDTGLAGTYSIAIKAEMENGVSVS
jgi:hypothetical protein